MSKAKKSGVEWLSSAIGTVLSRPGGPTQKEIAKKAGVDQGFVSRLKNGQVRKATPRTRAVGRVVESEYANMRKVALPVPLGVDNAVVGYLASGGDADLLVRQLDLLRAAHARSPRPRIPRPKQQKR